ncbi:MAG TPA: MGMT family protein [Candidatus Paceibacterota bacterium]|jgi:O-6-methylguanine DNA methyltransferase
MKKSFTTRVLSIVRRIPRGSVLTYGEIAKRAGNPDAARAVGTIMSKNFDPLVPCHRVIRSDGALGGYNRGVARKKKLLQEEGYLV